MTFRYPLRDRLKTCASFSLVGLVWMTFAWRQAHAQATASGPVQVDFADLAIAAINMILPIVAAIATYLINGRIKDQQMASLLGRAVENGVGFVQHSLVATVGRTNLKLQVDDPAIAAGFNYVKENAKEAIAHFGIPDDRIKAKLLAKLGLLEVAPHALTPMLPPANPGAIAPGI